MIQHFPTYYLLDFKQYENVTAYKQTAKLCYAKPCLWNWNDALLYLNSVAAECRIKSPQMSSCSEGKKNQQRKISLGFLNTHAESSHGPVNCELKFHFTVGLCMFSLIKHTHTHWERNYENMSLGEYYFHLSDFISGLIIASTKYEI